MARRIDQFRADPVQITFQHAATTSTVVSDVYTVPAGRSLVIERVIYIPSASLGISGAAYVAVQVLNVAAVAASMTTFTGGAALVAGVTNATTLSGTAANINVASGAAVRLNLACTGSPALGIGTVRIEGHLL